MLQLLAATPLPETASDPRAPHQSAGARADPIGPGDGPWTPGAPTAPQQSGAAPGGGVSPFGGASSVSAAALLVAFVGLAALFFESLILPLARWRSAFIAPLEQPG
jgi:hypothetical protein